MEIQIGNRLAEVTLLSKSGNKVDIDVDGKVYSVDICMMGEGQCSVLSEGKSYTPFIVHKKGTKHYSVSLNYSVYEVDMLDAKAKYMRMRRQGLASKQADTIKAPMPAKVINVFVHPGQQLKAGDVVLTIEAMKMQSSIMVSEDCSVDQVKCAPGDIVMAEQVMVTLNLKKEE